MKKFAVIALMVGIGAVPALADQFNFSYSDSLFSMSGVLDTTQIASNEYLVTGVTNGQITDANGTFALNLIPVGATPEDYNGDEFSGQDNLIFTSPSTNTLSVDTNFYNYNNGLYFDFASPNALSGPDNINGGSDILISASNTSGAAGSYQSDAFYYVAPGDWGYNVITTGGNFALTPVPDGGTTLLLLGLAVAGLAGLRRKLSM